MSADNSDDFFPWGEDIKKENKIGENSEPVAENAATGESPDIGGEEIQDEELDYDPFDIEQVIAHKSANAEVYRSIADYERAEAAKAAAKLEAQRKKKAMEEAEKNAEIEARLLAEKVARERAEEAQRRAEEAERQRLAEAEKRKAAEIAWLEAEKRLEDEHLKKEAERLAREEEERRLEEERIAREEEERRLEEERIAREEEERRLEEERIAREEEERRLEEERIAREREEQRLEAERKVKEEMMAIEEARRQIEEEKKKLAEEQAQLAEERRALKADLSADTVRDALEREFLSQNKDEEAPRTDDIGTLSLENEPETETEPEIEAETDDDVVLGDDEVEETIEEAVVNLREKTGDWDWKKQQKKTGAADALAVLAESKKTANVKKIPEKEPEDEQDEGEQLTYPRIDYVGNFPEDRVSGPIGGVSGGGIILRVFAAVIAAILLVLAVNLFIIRPEKVENGGMKAPYGEGTIIAVSGIVYKFGDPKKDDIIVANLAESIDHGFADDFVDSLTHNVVIASLIGTKKSQYRIVGRVVGLEGEYVNVGESQGIVPDGCIFVVCDESNQGYVVPLTSLVGKVIG